jgi:F0F1-type ATP synthase membrane subunit b/b'
MLRQDSSSITPDHGFNSGPGAAQNGTSRGESVRPGNVDIQGELERLKEVLLDSPRLFGRTLVIEDQLLDQIELVQLNLPEAFHEAEEVVRHKEEILLHAEQYAQEIIEAAERRAAQLLNEMGILRQAEMEAQQVRQQTQQECDVAKEKTVNELERMRRQAQKELEEMQRLAIAECEEIQAGADEYADRVLKEMEFQLAEMMRVIRNGRQQLQPVQAEAPLSRSREVGPSNPPPRPPNKVERPKN